MDIQVDELTSVYSVSDLNKEIRYNLESGYSSVWVSGEVSQITKHSSGHWYFTLKDEQSCLSCVMFRGDNSKVNFDVNSGMKILCQGRVSVYLPRGQYQLTVQTVHPQGVGELQIAFEKMKKKLQEEGLFDEEIKRPIPYLPAKIGLVTSEEAAAYQDILKVLKRRFSNFHLVVAPSAVQGDAAAGQICRSIEKLNETDVDVIILARGGGSLEDLWAFNEECVARAIRASEIPVISAIGHEVDYTIADFASDLRAPTPSAAAEIVLPEKAPLLKFVKDSRARMYQSLLHLVENKRDTINELIEKNLPKAILRRIEPHAQQLDDIKHRLNILLNRQLDQKKSQWSRLQAQLDVLNPLSCLARGYSIVFDRYGKAIIKSSDALKPSDEIKIRLSDGICTAEVKEVIQEKNDG